MAEVSSAAMMASPECQEPNSILDTDLYKLTMHYAVWSTYPHVEASYAFINRSQSTQKFSQASFQSLLDNIQNLEARTLKREEKQWLLSTCPYLPSNYLDYLESFRFNPKQHLRVKFVPTDPTGQVGDLEISIQGLWVDTILYEVPLLSMISESYFQTVDRNWSYQGQKERAIEKFKRLIDSGCSFIEFGTRRRRSWKTQFMVIESLKLISQQREMPLGTSNAWMAYHFNLKPVGTLAHEIIMAEGAMNGYQGANIRSMATWESCFPDTPDVWIALTDTFSTKVFFKELALDPERAKRWKGLRQDSGDPKQFVVDAKNCFERVGVDPKTKLLIFSDGLSVEKCIDLHQFCQDQGVVDVYGIGTDLTNDFDKVDRSGNVSGRSVPLNIVIKLSAVNSIPCVKISDVVSKASGPKEILDHVRTVLEL